MAPLVWTILLDLNSKDKLFIINSIKGDDTNEWLVNLYVLFYLPMFDVKREINLFHYSRIWDNKLLFFNCSAERSYAVLKMIVIPYRPCSKKRRLNSVAIVSIEAILTLEIDYNGAIEKFAHTKSRRKCQYWSRDPTIYIIVLPTYKFSYYANIFSNKIK